MTTAVRLFLSSAAFGIVVGSVYWIVAREPAGTLLLGVMAAALSFVAAYIVVAEREADLASDDADAPPGARAPLVIGTFVVSSRWPPLLALSLLLVAAGSVVGTGLTIFGALCALLVLWGLVSESR